MKKLFVLTLLVLMVIPMVFGEGTKDKFEIEPYPWVKGDALKESSVENAPGSWLGYEKMSKNMKDIWRESKKGERPILYIEIISEISNNLTRIPRSIRSDPTECEYVNLRDNQYLMFSKYNKGTSPSSYKLFYTPKGEIIRKDVNIICKTIPRGIAFNTIFDSNNKYLTFDTAFAKIDKNNFNDTLTDEKVEYYIHHDLYIDEVDVYGNIKGRYGEEEFIIGPKEKWESKPIENSIPRKYFKYDWPEYKNGKWEYKEDTIVRITGHRKEKEIVGKYTTYNHLKGMICEIKNPDKFLLKKSGSGMSIPTYKRAEILEIIDYIKTKYPEIKIKGMEKDWEYFSIAKIDYEGKINDYLPKIGNPKFLTQIKIINHGWMVYYY